MSPPSAPRTSARRARATRVWDVTRRLVDGAFRASRPNRPWSRMDLVRALLVLEARWIVGRRIGGGRRGSIAIMGRRVHYEDLLSFLVAFREIFLREDYAFDPGRDPSVIVDGGGNIGLSTLYFKWIDPQARVIVFEPDPGARDLLRRNVAEGDLRDVEIHEEALGARDGHVRLFPEAGRPTSMRASTTPGRVGGEPMTVPMVRLSPLLPKHVDVLKLDIEGAEADVLREVDEAGALRRAARIFVEVHHHAEPEDDRLSQVLLRLERNGFGYQLATWTREAPAEGTFQDVLVRAYRRDRDGVA